ncbi:MAG: hypothetical protein ACLQFF_09220 [Steroidobacteraceae bacterium]|jgi:hypothetical protein
MAEAQFYLVYLKPARGRTLDEIAKQMNLAVDWYRIDPLVWVLYTTSDADKWTSRLAPFAKGEGDGYLLVCKLDISDRQGWMAEAFWKWLRREHKES